MQEIKKEQPGLRDIIASNVAGILLNKTDINVDPDVYYLRELKQHEQSRIEAVAFIAYKMADALLRERNR